MWQQVVLFLVKYMRKLITGEKEKEECNCLEPKEGEHRQGAQLNIQTSINQFLKIMTKVIRQFLLYGHGKIAITRNA
eukprot:c41568_g1_i1 orf=3-230(-)